MKIHFIAIGGKVMHNLALELAQHGHEITGSDDEIYDPARSRLEAAGLLPEKEGWFEEKITPDLELIILGMHAHLDNPELKRARALAIRIVSFPEYIGAFTANERRIVIAGSHGKSTTTAMIMHALRVNKLDADFLLGGMLDGFDRMVRISGAPLMVIEGDEYLSSRLDPTPKMLHYSGDIVVITGIEWDHMNVFPTFDIYKDQFRQLLLDVQMRSARLFYYEQDRVLSEMIQELSFTSAKSYKPLTMSEKGIVCLRGVNYPVQIFGEHNMANLSAALQVCLACGLNEVQFMRAMTTFTGVGKRLELLSTEPMIYLDYAHAPSKVRATVNALKDRYPSKRLVAVYELHTYSSLQSSFLPQYASTMNKAEKAIVFYDKHALKMKRLPPLDAADVADSFGHADLHVIRSADRLKDFLDDILHPDDVIVFMSSGNFGGLNLKQLVVKNPDNALS